MKHRRPGSTPVASTISGPGFDHADTGTASRRPAVASNRGQLTGQAHLHNHNLHTHSVTIPDAALYFATITPPILTGLHRLSTCGLPSPTGFSEGLLEKASVALTALDLSDSLDLRERSAGLRVLDELLAPAAGAMTRPVIRVPTPVGGWDRLGETCCSSLSGSCRKLDVDRRADGAGSCSGGAHRNHPPDSRH